MTKGEHTRLVAWRWRLLCRAADENNVARTCRHFGTILSLLGLDPNSLDAVRLEGTKVLPGIQFKQ